MIFEMTMEAGEYLVWCKSRYNEYQVTFNDSTLALKFLKSVTQEVD